MREEISFSLVVLLSHSLGTVPAEISSLSCLSVATSLFSGLLHIDALNLSYTYLV